MDAICHYCFTLCRQAVIRIYIFCHIIIMCSIELSESKITQNWHFNQDLHRSLCWVFWLENNTLETTSWLAINETVSILNNRLILQQRITGQLRFVSIINLLKREQLAISEKKYFSQTWCYIFPFIHGNIISLLIFIRIVLLLRLSLDNEHSNLTIDSCFSYAKQGWSI